jgi:thiol-disulfide isomerase/thioredoxin
MAYTLSNMIPLGTPAPDFTLPEPATGKDVRLSDIPAGKATVVMFLCNHCPYVLYINPEIVRIVEAYAPQGVAFVGINSNDAETHPDDAPETMGAHAEAVGYTFPYLFDATQEVARQYDAACTPDFYIFDGERKLVYRGQLDESRPKRNPVPATGSDLRAALDAVLNGTPVAEVQRPSGGCNIKWKE